MMRSSTLQQIRVPKCKRSARVKRRRQYAGFSWISFGSDLLRRGDMSQCSSSKDNSRSIFARKTNLFYEIPISEHQRRGHNISRDENMIFLERENKENVCKRLERSCRELESATQSTISDSTEDRCAEEMARDTLNQYHFVEIPRSFTGSDAADSYSLHEKKSGLGCFEKQKHLSPKTVQRAQFSWWPAESFGEKRCTPRLDFHNALEEASSKRSSNHHGHYDGRYQSPIVSRHNPSYDEAAWKASNSNRVKGDETEYGRGKRKRKPKVHFDEEVSLSVKSLWRMRRLRIMRHLGLVAPPGSPFVINPPVRSAA
ncbi:uncharacterized protein LOC131043594 [Cryptomeria japonica]|uniref:uncharacterized protein LOC131043594 n=1 Tax=Cryptomeria japonica TaxID=3369 RepID=UPI0027DA268A|nr:uncharacterized protein LOC131043594 [Cryptomeria japonica]